MLVNVAEMLSPRCAMQLSHWSRSARLAEPWLMSLSGVCPCFLGNEASFALGRLSRAASGSRQRLCQRKEDLHHLAPATPGDGGAEPAIDEASVGWELNEG